MYQALYRKYRPKNFDEVVGQEHITSVLKQEIASGRIGHAYLFTGSRGTGKTSCSKIIAKAVNCPHQQDGNPCGVCDICRGIDDGSILDVTEIDAASNNGVDNIRQLREEANFTPAVTNYRVYIIDETHMLSTGAFNALLKIMEEPLPDYVRYRFSFWEDSTASGGLVEVPVEGEPEGGTDPEIPAGGWGAVHTVRKGETLWGIAWRYGVALTALIAANPQIKNPNLIYPGDQVRIP